MTMSTHEIEGILVEYAERCGIAVDEIPLHEVTRDWSEDDRATALDVHERMISDDAEQSEAGR